MFLYYIYFHKNKKCDIIYTLKIINSGNLFICVTYYSAIGEIIFEKITLILKIKR